MWKSEVKMQILDIDEALKDDSFIFPAERTHDEVSNILQQWRMNNAVVPSSAAPLANDAQTYNLNSKTFTRPKRKVAQNLELQFANNAKVTAATHAYNGIDLEIGGLVTNLHKTFLHDTSPPSSISSSMGISVERMSNSLITSADFANLNFLQSAAFAQNADKKPAHDGDTVGVFHLPNQPAAAAPTAVSDYTFGDMLRDRNALDSLTMSVDETLIKDMHIAQIDDISLTFSKTNSGSSTMDNSTDSMEHNSRSINATIVKGNGKIVTPLPPTMHRTLILNSEMISDTTFNLVEMSLPNAEQSLELNCEFAQLPATLTTKQTDELNGTYKAIDATVCLAVDDSENVVLDVTPQAGTRFVVTEESFHTPQSAELTLGALRFSESTPYVTSRRLSIEGDLPNRPGTPSLPIMNDECLSPIERTPRPSLEGTFDCKVLGISPQPIICNETVAVMQGDIAYNKTFDRHMKTGLAAVNLEELDVEKLAQHPNEEEFENLLDELGKVEPSAEELKMRKSLESLRKRFSYSNAAITGHVHEEQVDQNGGHFYECNANEINATITANAGGLYNTMTLSKELSSSGVSLLTTSSVSSQASERLLNRRSRLFDDVTSTANFGSTDFNSTSFVIQTHTQQPATEEPLPVEGSTQLRKSAARRERDRDRFKTVDISNPQAQGALPDAEATVEQENIDYEFGRADCGLPSLTAESGDLTEVHDTFAQQQNNNNNYLTYKKPRDKQENRYTIQAGDKDKAPMARPQVRSLSRPRFLGGLQKYSTVTKAISASDLPKSTSSSLAHGMRSAFSHMAPTSKLASNHPAINYQQPVAGQLKSPMGLKSKSFHNLSSNINNSNGLPAPRNSMASCGLRRPTINTEMKTNTVWPAAANEMTSGADTFKVPRPLSSIRPPGASGAKRGSIARPTSGYFSLNAPNNSATAGAMHYKEFDNATSDSVSTGSSRSSVASVGSLTAPNERLNRVAAVPTVIREAKPSMEAAPTSYTLAPEPSRASMALAGKPKLSGLRPPSNIKRSGLPRPTSLLRR